MDSFYEQPRVAPTPMTYNDIFAAPVVPEVSMLFDEKTTNNTNKALDSMLLPYNTWKIRNQESAKVKDISPVLDNPGTPQSNFLSKCQLTKQVRFENMNEQQQRVLDKQQLHWESPDKRTFSKTQTYEQIYMGSIPDHHLDLSVIESPKIIRHNKENISPSLARDSYTNFKNKKIIGNADLLVSDPLAKNQFVDMYHYKTKIRRQLEEPTFQKEFLDNALEPFEQPKKKDLTCNTAVQTENYSTTLAVNSNDEPTIRDLLKIIHQQNNQILILQKQVATLLDQRGAPNKIEPVCIKSINDVFNDCPTSTQHEFKQKSLPRSPAALHKKAALKQFSLDVMTSFEVSIRRQQLLNRFENEANPKICELEDQDVHTCKRAVNGDNILDDIPKVNKIKADTFESDQISLTFNEPVQVVDNSPSPENSIKIDLKEYSSDSEEENQQEWNVYNNGQVNNILSKPTCNKPQPGETYNNGSKHLKQRVKEATMKHLKSIGVNIPDTDKTDEQNCSNKANDSQNDVSFMVKQLLMKYLPNEHLARLAYSHPQEKEPLKNNKLGADCLPKTTPDFSFATLQYMQKYNLIDKQNSGPKSLDDPFSRILDVTAIKQQPKLL